MKCRECQDLLVDALYGELDAGERERFESHVVECAKCAALATEMRETLSVMDRRQRTDPGEAYWTAYYDRLRTRMAREEYEAEAKSSTSWWRRIIFGRPVSSWTARAAAGALILVIGVMVGRTFFLPSTTTAPDSESVAIEAPGARDSTTQSPAPGTDLPPVDVAEQSQPSSTPTSGAIDAPPGEVKSAPKSSPRTTPAEKGPEMQLASATDVRAQRYIERSQMLLLAIVNSDPDAEDYDSDFSVQQARSRELVGEADGLIQDLNDPKQRRLRDLVMQLERILMEIANLEAEDDIESVDLIRGQVNRNDVMLKINLEQMRLDDKVYPSSSEDQGRSL